MQQYYFLFALALAWTIFAVVQDFKTREVANWLNFSLVAFALAYRAFYAIQNNDKDFFVLGFLGFLIFFALAYAFYYGKAFAGGDAKLLMGYGAILPFSTYSSLFTTTVFFLFLLFLAGSVYSIIYSFVIIIPRNKKTFTKEFKKRWAKHKALLTLSTTIAIVLLALFLAHPITIIIALFFLIPILYIYTFSLDKCMIKLYPSSKLTEGDWLAKNVKVGNKTIKKSIHGLSLKEIKLLKKHKKKVLIKEGVPFTPAFLIALIILIILFVKFGGISLNLFI